MSCVYTLWLKRRTPQNIVIGGLSGALPPAIGWAAVTGSPVARAAAAGGDHLHVDAAAFLGAVAVALRRLCARRRADDAGGAAASASPAARSCSTRWCWSPSGLLPAVIGLGGPLYLAASALDWRFWLLLEAVAVWRETRRSAANPRRIGCSACRCFICLRLFAALIVERLAASSAALRHGCEAMIDEQNRRTRRERRKRNIALALVLGGAGDLVLS